MGGGSGSQTVNQRADPWAGVQPFLLGSGPQNYGGNQGGSQNGFGTNFNTGPYQGGSQNGFGTNFNTGPYQGGPQYGDQSQLARMYQGGAQNFNEKTGTTNPFQGEYNQETGQPWYNEGPPPQQAPGPPPPQIPGILPEASRLYQDVNPSFFPSSTVAQFSPYQQAAQSLTANRAMQGSPIDRAASNQVQGTLGGNYFGGGMNPLAMDALSQTARGDFIGGEGFNNSFRAAYNKITPSVDSAFQASGRGGSGLADVAKTEALGNAFAGLYGQERQNQLNAAGQLGQFGQTSFENERQRQLQALGISPMLANQDYADFGQLMNVGGQQQGLNQQNIQEQIGRHDFGQNLPFWKLGQYQNFINPILGVGGSSSSTSPLSSNPLAGAVGGGLLGYQAGGAIGGGANGSPYGGYGAAIGALLGALSSRS